MTGRELFPTSDCLKAHQRVHLIHEEIERQDADILCMQVH
jgi:RNA exonuclease NGL2